MKNETIKTYTEITPLDGLKLLVESGGKPIEGLAHKEARHSSMVTSDKLLGIDTSSKCQFKFRSRHYFSDAFKVTEIDPCVAPDGCPKLEPWMAYVGKGRNITESVTLEYYVASTFGDGNWNGCVGASASQPNDKSNYAIDVRTEWAQEHFPEHCRIRNYQEPDAFEDWWKDNHTHCGYGPIDRTYFIEAYKLGQANPTKGTK